MTKLRPPAVAGTFYPDDPQELRATVERAIDEGVGDGKPLRPKALIAPHAGYTYSGPVAGSAYRALGPKAGGIRRAVILSPSHYLPFEGMALSRCEAFRTPLGEVPIDRPALQSIDSFPGIRYLDAAHSEEHGIEVHLPFLQVVAGDFTLVPVVVGQSGAAAVAELLEVFGRDEATLIVASSDLSHYLSYSEACEADGATCSKIEALDDAGISPQDACGAHSIAGLLCHAKRHGLHATTLDLRNSGDTAGGRSRVVGYGAWRFDR